LAIVGSSRTTTSSGDGQAQLAGQLTRDHLGHQRLATLPGAVELHDVRAEVVGLDQAGQRAALAQGEDVPGREHFTQPTAHDRRG